MQSSIGCPPGLKTLDLARAEAAAEAGATEILYAPACDDRLGQAETFDRAVDSVQG